MYKKISLLSAIFFTHDGQFSLKRLNSRLIIFSKLRQTYSPTFTITIRNFLNSNNFLTTLYEPYYTFIFYLK